MDENNNRYSGKRWVSREEMDRQGRNYEKKNTGSDKRSYDQKRDGYRKDGGYRAGQKDDSGRYEKKDRYSNNEEKTGYRPRDRYSRKDDDRLDVALRLSEKPLRLIENRIHPRTIDAVHERLDSE